MGPGQPKAQRGRGSQPRACLSIPPHERRLICSTEQQRQAQLRLGTAGDPSHLELEGAQAEQEAGMGVCKQKQSCPESRAQLHHRSQGLEHQGVRATKPRR